MRGLGFNKERPVISKAYEESSRTNCVLCAKMTRKIEHFAKGKLRGNMYQVSSVLYLLPLYIY